MHLPDFDDSRNWTSLLTATLADLASETVIAKLVAAAPECVEDAFDLLLTCTDRERVVDAAVGWILSATVASYHGTRLIDSVHSIRDHGLVPLDTNARHHHVVTAKNGISSVELDRRLGVRQPTAWSMKQKIMEVMARREADTRLDGRVEMDDAYLGGSRSGGKRDRGAPGKTPFVAAVSTSAEGAPRKVKLASVRGFRKREIARGAKRLVGVADQAAAPGLAAGRDRVSWRQRLLAPKDARPVWSCPVFVDGSSLGTQSADWQLLSKWTGDR